MIIYSRTDLLALQIWWILFNEASCMWVGWFREGVTNCWACSLNAWEEARRAQIFGEIGYCQVFSGWYGWKEIEGFSKTIRGQCGWNLGSSVSWSELSVNVESNSLMLIDKGGSMFHYRRTSLAISRHLLLGLNQTTNANAFGDITLDMDCCYLLGLIKTHALCMQLINT